MTKHQRIAADLRDRLARGEWTVGEKLPTASALSEHYDAGLSTIGGVLRRLEQEGLRRVKQGSGAWVMRLPQ